MQINKEQSLVTFDRLLRADRSLGSAEAISVPKSAEVAVAPNAKGVFAARSILEINEAARASAANLRKVLTAA